MARYDERTGKQRQRLRVRRGHTKRALEAPISVQTATATDGLVAASIAATADFGERGRVDDSQLGKGKAPLLGDLL
ncbi:hypothetical protein Scep_028363 [Stephania cephalantha]|uniref:Uncharacterized protein n=1 Tax=Stephania cephalantha TaxID=152367 RepID=A0AAP0HM08_9MAGN